MFRGFRPGLSYRSLFRGGVLLAVALLLALSVGVSAAPTGEEGSVHLVRIGETLSSIARHYGTTAAILAEANGISNQNRIYVGQRLTIPDTAPVQDSEPAAGRTHVVESGESLQSIARKYGTTAAALADANGISDRNFIFVGQQLVIPGTSGTITPDGNPGGALTHVVQPGESLSSIARRYGLLVSGLASLNGIRNPNFLYVGMSLKVWGPAATPSKEPTNIPTTGRWVDVDLTGQMVTAYEGKMPVYQAIASTGLPGTPTVKGTYAILSKYPAVDMSGPGYYLPKVPWTMYFYRGYALHGAYWHDNFGQPMSHGCVNLKLDDAAWLYDFASVGTPVVVHD